MSVLLDRQGVANYAKPSRLLALGLIKLRDLPDNLWNADTLFVLTENHAQARELARIAEAEDWGGEVYVYENQDDIDGALGMGRDEYGLLTIWWD